MNILLRFDLDADGNNEFRQALTDTARENAQKNNELIASNLQLFRLHASVLANVTPVNWNNIPDVISRLGISAKVPVRTDQAQNVIEYLHYVIPEAPEALPTTEWLPTQLLNNLNGNGLNNDPATLSFLKKISPDSYNTLLPVRDEIDLRLMNRIACQNLIEAKETEIIAEVILGKIMNDTKIKCAIRKMRQNWEARDYAFRNVGDPVGRTYTLTCYRANHNVTIKPIVFETTKIDPVPNTLLEDADKVTDELVTNTIALINARRSVV